MTKVSVDPDLCTGHGRCYSLAADVFDADEVGHCLVLVEDVAGELEAQLSSGSETARSRQSRCLAEQLSFAAASVRSII